jgi:hypothetical protein
MRNLTVYKVSAGMFVRYHFTEHHAEQLGRALRRHGMEVTIKQVKLPNDALTKMVVGE